MPQANYTHPYVSYLWETVTIEFMIKFFVAYFFLVWIVLVIWVARDISRRSSSRLFQTFCVLSMIILTPIGVFFYLLIRPKKSFYDTYYEEIDGNLKILQEIVQERIEEWQTNHTCPKCDMIIEESFVICPECKTSLKHTCHSCHKVIREGWKVCPYCQTKQKKKKKTD